MYSQAENCAKSAGGKHETQDVVVIADTVFAFSANVLLLHNKTHLTLVEFPPFSLNLSSTYLPAKLLDYFLRSNKSNINQLRFERIDPQ